MPEEVRAWLPPPSAPQRPEGASLPSPHTTLSSHNYPTETPSPPLYPPPRPASDLVRRVGDVIWDTGGLRTYKVYSLHLNRLA
jgi:hypothetical protein